MERELNYLVLRYFEKYLDPEDYQKLKEKVSILTCSDSLRSNLHRFV